jgi:hypothetical protein
MPQVVNGIALDNTEGFDKITSTDKITKGYFVGDVGKLDAGVIVTGSLSATNENYYFAIAKDSVTGSTQFHIAYGNVDGKGANTNSDADKSKTEAIYRQWASTLLAENEVTGGFNISKAGTAGVNYSAGTRDTNIFVLVGKRSLFKDRINKKNWTIVLSGSDSYKSGSVAPTANPGYPFGHKIVHLTDDSKNISPTATPAGPRYNIVSGSQGTVATAASTRTFGFFYPDQGVLVFSGAELSASIPGSGSQTDSKTIFGNNGAGVEEADQYPDNFRGFTTTTNEDDNYHQALRFANCLKPNGAYLQFRSEEDQTSVSYFCRARAAHTNFSNNPTFVSGSQNELRHETMKGNPTTYISGVELYDGTGQMVAVGKLSTPLKKNFSSEATIKVKLTF